MISGFFLATAVRFNTQGCIFLNQNFSARVPCTYWFLNTGHYNYPLSRLVTQGEMKWKLLMRVAQRRIGFPATPTLRALCETPLVPRLDKNVRYPAKVVVLGTIRYIL